MRNKLRNIVVKEQTYKWRYIQYLRHLPRRTSCLLIFSNENHVCIRVFFHTHETITGGNPINEGLPFIKDGQRQIISFHKPRYVAELLEFIIESYDAKQFAKLVIDDGNMLIAQMGYREAYEEYKNPSFRFLY